MTERISKGFEKFEKILAITSATMIAVIILISVVRVLEDLYSLFVIDFFEPEDITFSDYQMIFGKIMTLLISMEFMASIIKVLKTHDIRVLTNDVILITALAIARKLIIYKYDTAEPISVLTFAALILSLGLFYYMINSSVSSRGSKH